jgi:alkylation response protein AidB-like acyl-CoA dehydrogenase
VRCHSVSAAVVKSADCESLEAAVNTFLSSTQETQLEQYREFAASEVAPVAAKLVSHEMCLKEFLQKLGQKGYLGITVPKEYGGQGGSLLDMALFVEAVSQYDPGLGLTLGDHVAVIEVLKKFGTDQQKSRYLPLLARGEEFATVAFSEPAAGTDFEAVQTSVIVDGGTVTVSGNKVWVVTGDFANSFLVLGKDAQGKLNTVLVDRPDGAAFKLVKERKLMGLQSAYVNDVEFANAKVNGERSIGDPQSARDVALYAMDVAKVLLAAAAVGLLEAATQMAVQHARQREQFGTNIGQFQGVQWKLADMGVDNAGARLLVYRAAWSCEGEPSRFHEFAAMCKAFAGRACRQHASEALQIMGASGLVEDGPMARFYDDSKVMEIAQGTSEFQKMLLVKELHI